LCFRTILHAFSNPGEICTFADPTHDDFDISRGVRRAAECLFDYDVQVWLGQGFDTESVRTQLTRITGCQFTAKQERADFAVIAGGMVMPPLERFQMGTRNRPDFSTTLIISLPSLTGGAPILLEGPGISKVKAVDMVGIGDEFWTNWDAATTQYPLGVDILFTSQDSYLALPRTSRRVS
jgi:alpha-D-ribose 1-methylphosphonate 5-triphosphate synthase subunit PhnH